MDIGSILLILGLLILVGLFVARPFMEGRTSRKTGLTQEEHEFSHLLAERDRLVNALQELDFDHALGKIPAEDYPAQRAVLLRQGAEVLRQIDEHTQAEAGVDGDLEKRIEAAIAARRADLAAVPAGASRRGPAVASPDDDIEALLANRRRDRSEKAAGFCPHCGGAVRRSDKFCPKCGGALN